MTEDYPPFPWPRVVADALLLLMVGATLFMAWVCHKGGWDFRAAGLTGLAGFWLWVFGVFGVEVWKTLRIILRRPAEAARYRASVERLDRIFADTEK